MTIDTLKSSELFRGLSPSNLEKVASLCRSGSYRPNTTIFKEGDEAVNLYILTGGQVALEMDVRPVPSRPAIPTAVEVCPKGQILGWSALVEPYTYTLSARCMTNCTVLAIKGDILRKLMDDDVSLGYELLKGLTKVITRRLGEVRLRMISGLGLLMLGKEPGAAG